MRINPRGLVGFRLAVATVVVGASAITLAQQGPLLFASMSDRTITLHPSGATFQVPDAIYSPTQPRPGLDVRFTTYLSRPDLGRVKTAPPDNEWDGPYSSILNVVLAFDSCAVHFGTEPFGLGSKSFGDVQARAYVVDGGAKPILARIETDGLHQAKVKERFPDAAVTTGAARGAWNLTTLAYTMKGRADYAAPARIDFYTREFGGQTVVLVFMYSPSARLSSWTSAISEIVASFAWPAERRTRRISTRSGPSCLF